jgi:hypothetical protein
VNSKAFVRFLLKVALASVAFSCSLIARTNDEQCRSDGDCHKFPGYACDLRDHVCVRAPLGAGGDGAGGIDDPGGLDASTEAVEAATDDATAGPWGCLGHVASEPVAKSNPTLTLVLRDATIETKAVTSDIQATACTKLDTACAKPSAGPLAPDPTGAVPLAVEAGFAGFVELQPTSASAAYPPFLFFVNPPVNNDRTSVVPLVSSANFSVLVTATGGGRQDPSLGSVIFLARDCLGSAAEGVSASIDGASTPVEGGLPTGTRFYFANGLPSLSVSSTDLRGIGGFINVVPGTHVVTAVRQSTGMTIAKISVLVRPGTITLASLSPLP